ncbi:hypothetical protein BH24ACT24_BH24ACT24_11930 [soil metagenome]
MPEFHVDDRLPWAVTWTAREPMERSAHALAADGRVWLVDPMADDAALRAAEALGEVVGVLQLLDRHPRDCVSLARRYGVPHLRLPEQLPGSPFEVRRITWLPGWREVGLWWGEHEAFVIPEAVGTASYFAVGGRPLGVHPFLRAQPPAVLWELAPRELLVGHGQARHENGAPALGEALDRTRRDVPRAALAFAKAFAPGGR